MRTGLDFLKRNRIAPDLEYIAGVHPTKSLVEMVREGQAAGARWQQLIDVTLLGGDCQCKTGHACNYTDGYIENLLLPRLHAIVPPLEAAGLLDTVYACMPPPSWSTLGTLGPVSTIHVPRRLACGRGPVSTTLAQH